MDETPDTRPPLSMRQVTIQVPRIQVRFADGLYPCDYAPFTPAVLGLFNNGVPLCKPPLSPHAYAASLEPQVSARFPGKVFLPVGEIDTVEANSNPLRWESLRAFAQELGEETMFTHHEGALAFSFHTVRRWPANYLLLIVSQPVGADARLSEPATSTERSYRIYTLCTRNAL